MPRIADMRKVFPALILAATCLGAAAQPAVDAHLAAAKKAEGTDFPGTLARLCVVPDTPVGGGGARATPTVPVGMPSRRGCSTISIGWAPKSIPPGR
jgi:hypothetical protein